MSHECRWDRVWPQAGLDLCTEFLHISFDRSENVVRREHEDDWYGLSCQQSDFGQKIPHTTGAVPLPCLQHCKLLPDMHITDVIHIAGHQECKRGVLFLLGRRRLRANSFFMEGRGVRRPEKDDVQQRGRRVSGNRDRKVTTYLAILWLDG